MEILEQVKNFYKTKKILVILIIIVWLLLVISLGIFIGIKSKPDIIPLTPEEENAKIVNSIKEDEEKIYKGEMLSTKNNLSFEDLDYSSNYVESRKK